MVRILLGILLLTVMPPAYAGAANSMDISAQLDTLYADYWDFQMRQSPIWATYLGDHRYDDRLPDVSPEAVRAESDTLRAFRERLKNITSMGELPPGDSLNVELLDREVARALEDLTYRNYLMPITQQSGPQISFPELVKSHPLHTVDGCENYIKRLQAFRPYIRQIIANMRAGMAVGLVPAAITMEKALPQIRAHVVGTPDESLLADALEKIGEDIPESGRTRLGDAILDAIRVSVIPAFNDLAVFVEDEYLPACRDTVGILALPDGKQRYRYLARHYTTTRLSPETIFRIGERELAAIHDRMRAIMRSLEFDGTLQEFVDSLRHDTRFYYTTGDSLVEGFKVILRRMDEKLPLLFGRLPQAPYGYKEIESYRAASAPDAYYYPAPNDGSRPGYFYINTYRPEMRPKYTMEALAYHEAVPGHHLQIAIQQELAGLPQFRRNGGYTAFVEGWGLYSEQLPAEVGLYDNVYSEFGRLTFDAWRAARLVVDPGIHYYGWTRDRAIAFFRENTALSDQNIVSEVERYIAWPGQALAYKIGQLKIGELRNRAEDRLGDGFDIRAFHDELLLDGALPLDLLEIKMDRWLREKTENGG